MLKSSTPTNPPFVNLPTLGKKQIELDGRSLIFLVDLPVDLRACHVLNVGDQRGIKVSDIILLYQYKYPIDSVVLI